MKLWLASTDPDRVAQLFSYGVFEGVLTNPTMIASTGRPPIEVIRDLCAAAPGTVFCQLRNGTPEEMKGGASKLLSKGWGNLGIKVPLTRDGCAALHWLREQRVALRLATCVPATAPLLLATALDVPWVTPVGSMLEKLGGPSKVALLTEMQSALDQQRSSTILIPSLSTPAEMRTLALLGIRSGFVWDRDADSFLDNELVRRSVAGFDKDWEKLDAAGEAGY